LLVENNDIIKFGNTPIKKVYLGTEIVYIKDHAYFFKNGKYEFSDGSYVEITNGNHVFLHCVGGKGVYFNISHIDQNTINSKNSDNADYKPLWFTIPANSKCTLSVKNVTNHMPDANFRLALKDISTEFYIGDDEDRLGKEITLYPEEDLEIGCFFAYMDNNMDVEFDVVFIVDEDVWIG